MQQQTSSMPLLGAHMSIAGGVHTAIERANSIGCTTMQMFVKNNNQWGGKPLSDEDVASYKKLHSESNIHPVMAHGTYLINLCARDPSNLKKSRSTFLDELHRCERLGLQYLNVHPGAHLGAGEEEGIALIAESLNLIHEQTKGYHTVSVLETTAGQGTALGYRFEQLQKIIDLVDERQRVAVCVDTCHLFAAGYDIGTEEGYEATFTEFDAIIGLDRLIAFHVNDSKRERGSRIDRHEHIGKGHIGLTGFRLLMNDTRFAYVPKILETPKGVEMKEDVANMKTLMKLVAS
jgi:deoxyribonuclease IV